MQSLEPAWSAKLSFSRSHWNRSRASVAALGELACRPFGGGIGDHVEMNQLGNVIAEEGAPSLRGRPPWVHPVPRYGCRGHINSQLEQRRACLVTVPGFRLDLIFNFNYIEVWRRGRDSNPGYSF